MQPIDTDSGKSWATVSSNAAHAHIRAECLADLRKRDARFGIGDDGKVYFDPTSEQGQPGRYVVDEELARKKHTGGEYVALIRSRWATFCSVPQSEAAFMTAHQIGDRTHDQQRFNDSAQDIEATLVDKKPKAGRPVGSKNKPKPTSETVTSGEPTLVMAVSAKG